MPQHKKGFLGNLAKRVFQLTGFHLNSLLKFGAVLLVAAVGIGWTLLYTGAEQDSKTSGGVEPERLTSEQKFTEISIMPGDFSRRLPVERMGILNSKIKYGEELANSEGKYADQASEMLVFLYGSRCILEESEGLDSEKTYRRLAELRQAALAAGNDERVAAADFLRVVAATNRLNHRSGLPDFRFASDAISNLDSSKLDNIAETERLYIDAVKLHNTSSDQDSTAIFLSLLADKLIDSPESAISDLGLNLKDYPKYVRFYEAVDKLPPSTRESKLEFYDELFAEIDNAPPQSAVTYRIILQLLDRLLNKSDLQTAKLLTKRLAKAASVVSPKIKAKVDQSIENIETRIDSIGKTIDLSGSNFEGATLKMPNGKPTTLVFWRPSDVKSAKHIRLLAESEWFDPWESNVLIACPSQLSEEQLKNAGRKLFQFQVLDNATSERLAIEIGIDLVPYQVSFDKDNKVIRLGGATN
jgi:hypothetical protein